MDNCTNWKIKKNIYILRQRAFTQPVASQVMPTEVSKLSCEHCECIGFAHRLIKCSWNLQRGFLCPGFEVPISVPSLSRHECPADWTCPGYRISCMCQLPCSAVTLSSLATMRFFLSQKLEACFDKNSVGQKHMLNKTKV